MNDEEFEFWENRLAGIGAFSICVALTLVRAMHKKGLLDGGDVADMVQVVAGGLTTAPTSDLADALNALANELRKIDIDEAPPAAVH